MQNTSFKSLTSRLGLKGTPSGGGIQLRRLGDTDEDLVTRTDVEKGGIHVRTDIYLGTEDR